MAHNHSHDHGPANYNRAFAIGIALNIGFVVVEAVFGFLAGSLALLADAGHNLSDVLGLLLAWGGSYMTTRRPTRKHTYGWRRTSILAALGNAILLLMAVGGIAWEAIRRFDEPAVAAGATVMWVAAAGVLVNGVTAWLFVQGRKDDINIRGAFLHMAADAGVSLGVVLAGFAIVLTGLAWIDPATSLIIALIIALSTWGLLRESFNQAMDAVPENIDPDEVQDYLASLPGVVEVHDLHIWPMSTTEAALTAHLVVPEKPATDALLECATCGLHDRFGIEHATIQIETNRHRRPCMACEAAPAHVHT